MNGMTVMCLNPGIGLVVELYIVRSHFSLMLSF